MQTTTPPTVQTTEHSTTTAEPLIEPIAVQPAAPSGTAAHRRAILEAFALRLEYPAGDAEMEELYTATFDFDSACAPYVGHHLFGEGPRRGAFMARLVELYRDAGFDPTSRELPDHISVVLRYLAVAPAGAARDALVADALVPALDAMLKAPPIDAKNAYRPLLLALREEVTR